MGSKIVSFLTISVGLLAVVIGLLLSPIPSQLGLYKWLTNQMPRLTGLAPLMLEESDWNFTFEQLSKYDLTGQRAIVTGGNSGVGFATAMELAKLGAAVTIACRNPIKCTVAAQEIKSQTLNSNVNTMTMDTSSLQSVREAALDYIQANPEAPLDMLFLNAGILSGGANQDGSLILSKDGIELVFATNHVGHHLLFRMLEPLLLRAPKARIVLTSSAASFTTFPHGVATDLDTLNSAKPVKELLEIYGQSKLAQIMFAKELSRRQGPNSKLFVNAFHPGAVNTKLSLDLPFLPDFVKSFLTAVYKYILWDWRAGALTGLYLGVATDELEAKNIRGKYFHPQAIEIENSLAMDRKQYGLVWDFSNELVKDFV